MAARELDDFGADFSGDPTTTTSSSRPPRAAQTMSA
jgi:hypothetical protein